MLHFCLGHVCVCVCVCVIVDITEKSTWSWGMINQQYKVGGKNTYHDALIPLGTSDAQGQTSLSILSFIFTQGSREPFAKL